MPRSPTADASIKVSNVLKRFLDILLSCIALLVLSPVLVLVSIVLYLIEGAPLFYISQRYISSTRCVAIFKFRTMVRDAGSAKYALKDRFMRGGYLDVPLQCEVYTPLGRLLERTQLVEVLQFFNVLRDGMSLIGNRPLPPDNIEALRRVPEWQRRFDCPAGITGIAQVVGKHSLSPEERLELESLYGSVYKNPNGNILWCDLLIVLYTIRLLLFGKNLSLADAKSLLKRAHASELGSAELMDATPGSNH
jgi:lipopolysaccharide/colanic/teichoic acid biosynthesis glycosyltransferase